MKKRPWMPFYVSDYLADTTHLTTFEHGAYILLILYYWSNGGLPKDENVIRRIARVSPSQWKRTRIVIEDFFEDGWRHPRIDAELAHVIEKSNVNSANARKSHEGRKRSADVSQSERTHTSDSTLQTKEEGALRAPAPPPEDQGSEAPAAELPLEASSPKPSKPKREPKPKRAPSAASHTLPLDWAPSAANLEHAKGVGLTEVEFAREAKKFKNHWHATGKAYSNWDAVWRNWCDRALEYLGRAPKEPPKLGGGAAEFDRATWIKVLRLYAQTSNWSPGWGAPPGEPGCLVPPELIATDDGRLV